MTRWQVDYDAWLDARLEDIEKNPCINCKWKKSGDQPDCGSCELTEESK